MMVSPTHPWPRPGTIPFTEAEALGLKYHQRQVLIFSFDGEHTTIATWGADAVDSSMAAAGANELKRKWGWPENTIVESAKVQALYDRIAELEAIVERAVEKHGDQWGNIE